MIRNEKTTKKKLSWRRTWVLFPVDLVGICIGYVVSFELRFSWHIPTSYLISLFVFLPIALLINSLLYLVFKLYMRVWRYASVRDMQAIVAAVVCAAITIKVIGFFIHGIILPLSIWLSSSLLILMVSGSARMAFKVNGTSIRSAESEVPQQLLRILVYGAGSAGSIVSREVERSRKSEWIIVGFVDDDIRQHGLLLNGIPILGTGIDIPNLIERYAVDRILIAIPSLSRKALSDLVERLGEYKVPVLIVPPFVRWAVTNLFSQIRPVQVEDLLGRDPLPVETDKVGGYVNGTTVLVTGAGGSIGAEICRQIALLNPKKIVLLGRGENSIFEIDRELRRPFPDVHIQSMIADIRDSKKMNYVFETIMPDVVFHAAAHKHVPLMEEHPDEALVNNVFATKRLAELSVQYGVQRFVLISSDKAVRPTNVMGASKRVAEMAVQEIAQRSTLTRFVTVRFGNVLGSRGSVVRVFKEQIRQGGPVTITDERMMRYFMTIPEAVRLVIEAGSTGVNGHVYLLDMGEPVKIIELAEKMIRLSGFEPGVDIPIEITGIRPGEKLFEELLRASDSVSVDEHERIWTVQCQLMDSSEFNGHLAHLRMLYDSENYKEIGEDLKRLAWWEPGVSGAESKRQVAATDEP